VAIALPWLEIMQPERHARAASGPAKRFVTVFTPGGTVIENWRPADAVSGGELKLGPILSPLAEQRARLLMLGGVSMKSAVGEQNQAGIIAWLTGTHQDSAPNNFAAGPSVDQVVAPLLSAGYRLPSLQLAIRWGTGKSHGLVSPIDIANFADDAAFSPIPPRLDPQAIWQELFGGVPNGEPRAWDASILDAVKERYTKLSQRLGAADRQRLDQHLSQLRELETQIPAVCESPTLEDTSDYDPLSGLNHVSNDGSERDPVTDAAIPRVGKLMIDMLVMALACDITPVASLQWSDTEAKHTFPWLGLNQHLHFYMNDGGYQPEAMTRILTWYSEQHAYLLSRLEQSRTTEGRSLLDDTLVFFGSQIQHPANHSKDDMPFLLAGNGGGLRTNRYLYKNGESHNNLLVSICNLCGDPRQRFGNLDDCQGPMTELA
jgi:hypothetical protein